MSAQSAARSRRRRHRVRASRPRRDARGELAVLAPADRARRFADLQLRLAGAVAAAQADRPGSSLVVVPSRSVDKWRESAAETRAYEERLLCVIGLLERPNLRLVYVTSEPVEPAIAEHYLALLPRTSVAGPARA